MASPEEWMVVARENLRASRSLAGSEHWRSAVSRAYYSAFAASHAVLLHLDATPPARGNWRHDPLPGLIFERLGLLPGISHFSRDQFRRRLQNALRARIDADYHPRIAIGQDHWRRSHDAARSLTDLSVRVVE